MPHVQMAWEQSRNSEIWAFLNGLQSTDLLARTASLGQVDDAACMDDMCAKSKFGHLALSGLAVDRLTGCCDKPRSEMVGELRELPP
jgi:hypothetical protein